jgi:serine/threonine protein kinase
MNDRIEVPLPIDARNGKRCDECGSRFGIDATFCPFDGATLTAAPRDSIPDALLGAKVDGRYEVVALLGEGGMGKVYKVRHLALDRTFAMKVLRRDVARDEQLAARFIQEAKATASIKHPNVVSITDFGRLADDTPYFVMELLVGDTLATLLREGRIATRVAVPILLRIASALAASHEAGVVHRDLKPENIFLLGKRVAGRVPEDVRLVDFGAAKIMGKSRLTKKGIVFGTPHYMSPEQASGGTVDHRTDIYALGVIMYEMLAGRVPFEADTYMGVLTQHMYVDPTPPSVVLANGTDLGELEAVTMRALAKEPKKRFASMHEMIAKIEAVATSESPNEIDAAPKSEKVKVDPFERAHIRIDRDDLPTGDDIERALSSEQAANELRRRRLAVAGIVSVLLAVLIVAIARPKKTEPVPTADVPPVAHVNPTTTIASTPTAESVPTSHVIATATAPTSSPPIPSVALPAAPPTSAPVAQTDNERPQAARPAPKSAPSAESSPQTPAPQPAPTTPKHLGDFQDPWGK